MTQPNLDRVLGLVFDVAVLSCCTALVISRAVPFATVSPFIMLVVGARLGPMAKAALAPSAGDPPAPTVPAAGPALPPAVPSSGGTLARVAGASGTLALLLLLPAYLARARA